jgi:hypothetical protein
MTQTGSPRPRTLAPGPSSLVGRRLNAVAARLMVAAMTAGAASLLGVATRASALAEPVAAATTAAGGTATGTTAADVGNGTWAHPEPVAFGDAQLDVPASWPVVDPGTSTCQGGSVTPGVVLLGAFGTSSWCPPGTGQNLGQPVNLVRLGPLPADEPPVSSMARMSRNGVTLYLGTLHGRIAGPVYLVPSLGVELMATGPEAAEVLASIRPSVRERVMSTGPRTAPASWHRFSFAGLSFAVPPTWPTRSSAYVYDCALQDDDIVLAAPASVVLDTDTNDMALPCPYFFPARAAANGLVVDEGSAKAPNTVPSGATVLHVNGLKAFLAPDDDLAVLDLAIQVPGRTIPVEVHIGLGDPVTASRALGSIAPA